MGTNKHAVIRYNAIDKCLRNTGRKYFWQDLQESCNTTLLNFDSNSSGISRRQVFDDLKFMESEPGYSAPIERLKDGRKTYYRYTDLNFSINNQPINEAEANILKDAISTLSRFKGLAHFEWLGELNTRLEASFDLNGSDQEVISFDFNQYLTGTEYLQELYNSIVYKKVLEISYKPFHSTKTLSVIFHPYYLKQYNNRWFVFGYNEKYNAIMNMALDRIQKIALTSGNYIPNETNDFTEYFDDVIGVTVPDRPTETLRLKVSKSLWPYVKTKPLHHSQAVEVRHEDYVQIRLKVKFNKELLNLLCSYGPSIEVLEPKEIKIKMIELIKNMNSTYGI